MKSPLLKIRKVAIAYQQLQEVTGSDRATDYRFTLQPFSLSVKITHVPTGQSKSVRLF